MLKRRGREGFRRGRRVNSVILASASSAGTSAPFALKQHGPEKFQISLVSISRRGSLYFHPSPGGTTHSPLNGERTPLRASRLEPLNRGSRRKEALTSDAQNRMSLLTSAARRFMESFRFLPNRWIGAPVSDPASLVRVVEARRIGDRRSGSWERETHSQRAGILRHRCTFPARHSTLTAAAA